MPSLAAREGIPSRHARCKPPSYLPSGHKGQSPAECGQAAQTRDASQGPSSLPLQVAAYFAPSPDDEALAERRIKYGVNYAGHFVTEHARAAVPHLQRKRLRDALLQTEGMLRLRNTH